MDIATILKESTHFRTAPQGISFVTADKCGECGAEVYNNWTPWLRFDNVTVAECAEEAKTLYNMKEVTDKYYNESYYSETNDSEECCCECEG